MSTDGYPLPGGNDQGSSGDVSTEGPDGPSPAKEDDMGAHCRPEVWADDPGAGRVSAWPRKHVEPPPTSRDGVLLARLRRQPGRWLRVAEAVSPWWWFTADAKPANDLLTRRLAVRHTEHVRGFRSDIWLRALTPDERETEREIEALT